MFAGSKRMVQAIRLSSYNENDEDCEVLLDKDSPPSQKQRSWILSTRTLIVTAIVIVTLLIYFVATSVPLLKFNSWQTLTAQKVQLPHVYTGIQTRNPVNSTLGFEKILALNLPQRLDRKDELTLMSLVSDIKIDFLAARLNSELQEIGLPHHGKAEEISIGCWRAHVDAWQKVVDDRLTSALIIEDDIDWDVDIKKQLQRAHQPLATLLKSVSTDDKERQSTAADPWLHEDWDVLFFGHCLEGPMTEEDHPKGVDPKVPMHVLYDDDTIDQASVRVHQPDGTFEKNTIPSFMNHYGYLPSTTNTTVTKRLVARAFKPICLGSYAVSSKGAAKLLYLMTREVMLPIDVLMMILVATEQVIAYEVMPPIMAQWKVKDGGGKNSNNLLALTGDQYADANNDPSIGTSNNIANSVRRKMRDMLKIIPKPT